MLKVDSLQSYKILVTGACGFLGKRLVKFLIERGAFVVGVDFREPSSNTFKEILGNGSFHFISGDFLEKTDEAKEEFKKRGEIKGAVFHMAGLTNVEECERYPMKAFESNVSMTFQVLEFCRKNHIKSFVFPSTGLVYGDHLKRRATEKDPTFPRNVYVATKLSAEAVAQGYGQSFKLDCVIVRLSNVYGSDSKPETVVGTIIKQIKRGKEVVVHDLLSVRDFIYVDDVIEGLVRLLISADEPGCHIVNLSTGVGSSVQDLSEKACKICSLPVNRIRSHEVSKRDASRLILNNDILFKMTRWRPRYNLSEGLSLILKDH